MAARSPLRHGGSVWEVSRKALAPSARSLVAAFAGLAVVIGYLRATQLLTVLFYAERSASWIRLMWAEDWLSTLVRLRGPWLWEPAGSLTVAGRWVLMLAPINWVLGTALGTLVAWNVALALFAYLHRSSPVASLPLRGGLGGLLAVLPVLLTSAACCAPAILVGLGASLGTAGATFVSFLPYGLPVSLAALGLNGWWTARRLATAGIRCPVPDLARPERDASRGRACRYAKPHGRPAPKEWP